MKSKKISDARMMGIAIFDHIQETFNNDRSIGKSGYVSVERGEKMTKKDFIALADIIRRTPDDFTPESLYALAGFCLQQNPRFNESRWFAYIRGECGPNGGKL